MPFFFNNMENINLETILNDAVEIHSNTLIDIVTAAGTLKREVLKMPLWFPLQEFRQHLKCTAAYVIFNLKTQQLYVGSTKDAFSRLRFHRDKLLIGKHTNDKLQSGFNAKLKGFVDVLVIFSKDREEAYDIEQMLLDKLKHDTRLTNVAINARIPTKGIPWTQERKDFISRTNTGRVLSEETRKNMSKAQVGRIVSEETRKKQSISFTGRKLSPAHILLISERNKKYRATPETKAKLSLALKGLKKSPATLAKMREASLKHRKPIVIKGVVFESILIASKSLGIGTSTIGSRLRNKSADFIEWQYVE